MMDLRGFKNAMVIRPRPAIIAPGTMNDRPQFSLAKDPAITDPSMFPTDVCEFHMPIMNPRLPLPNQLPMQVTTLGHPVDWNSPAITYETKYYSYRHVRVLTIKGIIHTEHTCHV